MSYELFDGNCIGLAVEHAISEVKVATADCPIPIVGECAYITLRIGVLELTLVFTSLTVDWVIRPHSIIYAPSTAS